MMWAVLEPTAAIQSRSVLPMSSGRNTFGSIAAFCFNLTLDRMILAEVAKGNF